MRYLVDTPREGEGYWEEEQLDKGVLVRYQGQGIRFSFVVHGGPEQIEREKKLALRYLHDVDIAMGRKV